MRAGIWFDATFAYDTPLIVSVSASLDATLSMVPEVNRQTFAGPFNTIGNVIGLGLLQVAPDVLPPAAFGAADAAGVLPKAISRLKIPPTTCRIDMPLIRAGFFMCTSLSFAGAPAHGQAT
jgi:hypothetical protein